MKELLNELKQRINAPISIHFYRKEAGVIEKISDASYTVYLKEIVEKDNVIDLKCTNGMDNAGKSDFTVTFPKDSLYTHENAATWNIEYQKDEVTLIIKIFFPNKIVEKGSPSTKNPSVKEVRNPQGQLEKLIIETPDNGFDLKFLDNVMSIITQVMKSWNIFSVESVDNTEEQNKMVYEFSEIEAVTLPGNTFFEIRATSTQGINEFEVSTSLTIDLKASTLYFTIDEVPYTFRKIAAQ